MVSDAPGQPPGPDEPPEGGRANDGNDELPPDPFGPGELPDDLSLTDTAAGDPGGPRGAGDPAPDAEGGSGSGDPFGGFGMFGGMFGGLLGDISRQMAAQGPLSWDTARQVAGYAASGGVVEANVDPIERIRLEELCRIAEMHVAEATGLTVADAGKQVQVTTATRAQWAAQFLEEQRPLLEQLAGALGSGPAGDPGADDPTADLFAGMLRMIGPALLGMQAGALAGHLAQRVVGSYDLPLPRPAGDRITFVPANLAAFASDWSLPIDSVRMRLCLVELTHHAVLRVPWVHESLSRLLSRYASGYRVDPSGLESRLGDADSLDPASLERLMSDPQALLGAVTTPEQLGLRAEIDALVAAVVGYVDHVVEATSVRVLGGADRRLAEAMRRRRIEAGGADRMVEHVLGLTLDRALFERGSAFVAGVVERAGDAGLSRLWSDAAHLPTPAEVDAPGLWLARIDIG